MEMQIHSFYGALRKYAGLPTRRVNSSKSLLIIFSIINGTFETAFQNHSNNTKSTGHTTIYYQHTELCKKSSLPNRKKSIRKQAIF